MNYSQLHDIKIYPNRSTLLEFMVQYLKIQFGILKAIILKINKDFFSHLENLKKYFK